MKNALQSRGASSKKFFAGTTEEYAQKSDASRPKSHLVESEGRRFARHLNRLTISKLEDLEILCLRRLSRHPVSYNLNLIKSKLPEYLERTATVISTRSETRITALCPIHNGTDDNFHADLKSSGVWAWTCRSQCGGVGGSVVDLHADLHGLSRRSHEAIKGAAEVLGIFDDGESLPTMPPDQRKARAATIAEQARQRRKKERADEITEALAHRRESILEPYLSESWRADFWHNSPVILDSPESENAKLMIQGLYRPDDVLWLGDQFDSGKPRHAANFRTAGQWFEIESLPPRIAPGVFKPGVISRSDSNLVESPFIVIESDDLIGHKPTDDEEREENKRLCAALISLCRDRLKLNLRAVIDTGGKSLHGWYDRPSPEALAALMRIAKGFTIDEAVVTRASGPLRLPGCVHQSTGQPARLHYLNPKSL